MQFCDAKTTSNKVTLSQAIFLYFYSLKIFIVDFRIFVAIIPDTPYNIK